MVKTIVGILMVLLSIWLGSLAAYEFIGTWKLFPTVVTSTLTAFVGTVFVVAGLHDQGY